MCTVCRVKLKHFVKFDNMTDALAGIYYIVSFHYFQSIVAATATIEGKMTKSLKKLLKKVFVTDIYEELAVGDAKLGGVIKDKLNISCIHGGAVNELMRGIRQQMSALLSGIPESQLNIMSLGLSHRLILYNCNC